MPPRFAVDVVHIFAAPTLTLTVTRSAHTVRHMQTKTASNPVLVGYRVVYHLLRVVWLLRHLGLFVVARLARLGLFTFRKRVSLQPPTCPASVPTAGVGRWDIVLDDLGQRSAGPIL